MSWESDVFAAWRRAAHGAASPNSDVWGKLPPHVCWLSARIEEVDIPKLYLIGSADLKTTFGSYRLAEIVANSMTGPDDKHQHTSRIVSIGAARLAGKQFEPIIIVSYSGEGPFVIIDGNHRAVGMHRVGFLVGTEVYIGLHSAIGTEFDWFRQAILG